MGRWVHLPDGFDWTGPNLRSMVSFPRGDWFLTDPQADAAIAAGRGVEIKRPKGKRATAAGVVDTEEPPENGD